jgi:hypothetical protein
LRSWQLGHETPPQRGREREREHHDLTAGTDNRVRLFVRSSSEGRRGARTHARFDVGNTGEAILRANNRYGRYSTSPSRDRPRRQPFVAVDPSCLGKPVGSLGAFHTAGGSLVSTFSGIALRQALPPGGHVFPKRA